MVFFDSDKSVFTKSCATFTLSDLFDVAAMVGSGRTSKFSLGGMVLTGLYFQYSNLYVVKDTHNTTILLFSIDSHVPKKVYVLCYLHFKLFRNFVRAGTTPGIKFFNFDLTQGIVVNPHIVDETIKATIRTIIRVSTDPDGVI